MSDPLEIYPLVQRNGRWWLPSGEEGTADTLAGLFRSDCLVVFLGPDGGSFGFDVTDEGQEVVRLDYGSWVPAEQASLSPWQSRVYSLVQEAIDLM